MHNFYRRLYNVWFPFYGPIYRNDWRCCTTRIRTYSLHSDNREVVSYIRLVERAILPDVVLTGIGWGEGVGVDWIQVGGTVVGVDIGRMAQE